MPRSIDDDIRIRWMRIELQRAIMTAFCRIVHLTGLPQSEVLALAAEAVGTVYREAADAHSGINACSCGWEPDRSRDIESLLTALESALHARPDDDLRIIRTAGRA